MSEMLMEETEAYVAPLDNTQDSDVPKGYKKSEVGVIPLDWECLPLSKLFKFRQGLQVPIEKQSKSKNNRQIRFIRIVDLTDPQEVPRYIVDPGSKYHIQENDLFMVRYGSPGLIGFGFEGIIANNLFRLVPIKKLSEEFYYQYLDLRYADILDISSSSTMPAISFSTLSSFLVVYPKSKKEQTAIAKALSDVDTLINELEELVAKKQAIKTATMQQLLTGRKRLPEFANLPDGTAKGYKQTELGEIPEDWDVKAFGQYLRIRHGKNQKFVEDTDGKYPILGTGGHLGWAKSFLYDKPSVLIGRKGTIDKPRYVDSPFWTVDTLFYSELSTFCCPKFIYYKFCMVDWYQYNEASGVPSLNASTIENVLASFPSKQEQTTIAKILSDMDKDIQIIEERLTKTKQIKQGMMQQLLTGKTRLPF